MKKILIAAVVGLVPLAAFAEVELGPTAMLNFPMTTGDLANLRAADLGAEDFTFGADFRVNLDPLQLSAYALFTPGFTSVYNGADTSFPGWVKLYPDIGLSFKVLFLRFSVGVGPSFGFAVGGDTNYAELVNDYVSYGLNTKAMVDVYLGSVALSLIYLADFDLSNPTASYKNIDGYLGLSLLFVL